MRRGQRVCVTGADERGREEEEEQEESKVAEPNSVGKEEASHVGRRGVSAYLSKVACGGQAGRQYPGGRKKDGRADECKQKERQRESEERRQGVCVSRDIWGRG